MKRLTYTLLTTFISLSAWGQMTLHDCLVYALDNCPDNVIEQFKLDESKADTRIAASGLMPQLGFYSNGQVSFGRNIDPETNLYDNKQTLNSGIGLQLSVPVFDGLVNVNNLRAARTARLRQEQSVQVMQDRISLEVIKAFYNVVYCKAMVARAREQLQRDSTDMATIVRGHELGTKSGADVAEIAAIVVADRYEEINQANLLDKSYLELRHLMGLPLDTVPLELVECEYVSEESPANPFIHPEVAEATLAVKQAMYNVRSTKGLFAPVISLLAGINTSYYRMPGDNAGIPSFGFQWRNNMGRYVGISFSLPLFDGLNSVARLRRAKAGLAESRARLDKTKYEIEKAMLQARLDLTASVAEYESACSRLEAEKIAYQATRRRFELGTASTLDLYTSGAKLSVATANREGKRIQCIINRITVDYYNGKPLINN